MTNETVTLTLPLGSFLNALDKMTSNERQHIERHIRHLNNQDSALLRLPRELRNMIYEFAFKDHIRYLSARFAPDLNSKARMIPSLFETSQQLRSEGLHMLCADLLVVEQYDSRRCQWTRLSSDEARKLLLPSPQNVHFDTKASGYVGLHLEMMATRVDVFLRFQSKDADSHFVCFYTLS